ncbi:hypothetical protein JCM15457_1391 [Liquorilactobacillus sucicola DSM 21376 = JCM 15457]|uniref:DUF2187 domain-containing protein n=1 Tax=Liquorilactobacillus sucicola DSM 21376 = JCM 15457 TaxID=1423806 RepID=A0A023CX67_9LACO|nr:hypothetical protein [Liquorilactobacillus sucicola]KRN06979.1 hypothetical protein FD15_GL000542 [Liquorilactobacillus sucicola DSM 21376 = JCM 15457]GAJ26462.1 hypothetical protein JCM15457_1391 [Liquorilactobacillus sucicola DSM 21376 = JCM 15457]
MSEKRKSRNNRDEQVIEVSELGTPFVKNTHVAFVFHRHHFKGKIKKQLRNSAIIDFDSDYKESSTALELKQKVVISYSKMKLV